MTLNREQNILTKQDNDNVQNIITFTKTIKTKIVHKIGNEIMQQATHQSD